MNEVFIWSEHYPDYEARMAAMAAHMKGWWNTTTNLRLVPVPWLPSVY